VQGNVCGTTYTKIVNREAARQCRLTTPCTGDANSNVRGRCRKQKCTNNADSNVVHGRLRGHKKATKGVTSFTGDNRELCTGEATRRVGHSRRKRRLPRATSGTTSDKKATRRRHKRRHKVDSQITKRRHKRRQ